MLTQLSHSTVEIKKKNIREWNYGSLIPRPLPVFNANMGVACGEARIVAYVHQHQDNMDRDGDKWGVQNSMNGRGKYPAESTRSHQHPTINNPTHQIWSAVCSSIQYGSLSSTCHNVIRVRVILALIQFYVLYTHYFKFSPATTPHFFTHTHTHFGCHDPL